MKQYSRSERPQRHPERREGSPDVTESPRSTRDDVNVILIIDFGSQYTQLIARRIRELGCYSEIYPYTITQDEFHQLSPRGIILSGGPASVHLTETLRAPDWLFGTNIPILGICYGMQTMAVQLGGQVMTCEQREFGHAIIDIENLCLLTSKKEKLDVWMSHGDQVTELPPGFNIIGKTASTPIAIMADETRHFYGLQFHPEVTHTAKGKEILQAFVTDICKCPLSWQSDDILDNLIKKVREQVGSEHVLLALSGGVDSSVVAFILQKAIGKQLECVFVDTGLLRLNEVEKVLSLFANLDLNITVINAKDEFYAALQGVTCPEEKRKIIGEKFVRTFEREAQKHHEVKWLAQGTIYPDVIESAKTTSTHASETIKTHHNVGGLPSDLSLKLLEPIRQLFKDEVRALGRLLGLPSDMINRHPFPGPGLAVRILGSVKPEYINLLRRVDAIFIEELHKHQLYSQVDQAFAVFLPIKSVGVRGDGRQYDYVVALRAVCTSDFMTAEWARLPWDFLAIVSRRIVNEVHGISRVTYDISDKPPATIEWE